jgi:hypothetical protein
MKFLLCWSLLVSEGFSGPFYGVRNRPDSVMVSSSRTMLAVIPHGPDVTPPPLK